MPTSHDMPPITLQEDLEPWDRQAPAESVKRYAQFILYRDIGRTRTLRKVSDRLALHDRYVRLCSAKFLWVQRAEAWDLHEEALFQAAWRERRLQAAEHDAQLLGAFMGKVATRLKGLSPEDMDPTTLIRALDVTLRHRRQLFGDPVTIAVTGPQGGPIEVALTDFAGMTADRRQQAIELLLADVQRRREAAAGADDDE